MDEILAPVEKKKKQGHETFRNIQETTKDKEKYNNYEKNISIK